MFRFIKDSNLDEVNNSSNLSKERSNEKVPFIIHTRSESEHEIPQDNVKISSYQAGDTIVNYQNKFHQNLSPDPIPNFFQAGKNIIKYLSISELLSSPQLSNVKTIQKIKEATSDLLPKVYEGGFKIWECTFDLINFLELNTIIIPEKPKVLDIGCGSGLLGIYSMKNYNPTSVHFQDYNSEVIKYVTIPNASLNGDFNGQNVFEFCQFMSGDWADFYRISKDDRDFYQYDLILSSETVYNLDTLPLLCQLIKMTLKSKGIMLLAAKTYYFGVGGSTQAFCSEMTKEGSFSAKVAQVYKEGVQREIILVQKL